MVTERIVHDATGLVKRKTGKKFIQKLQGKQYAESPHESPAARIGYPEVMVLAMTYEDAKGARSAQSHSLSLSDRRRLTVSGVEDVESFDEDTVVLATGGGALTVRGSGLKIEKLSLDGGELVVEGRIDSLDYAENSPGRRSFFGRLLG